MIDACTHSSSATSKIISWCTPGGYVLPIVPWNVGGACSTYGQICVV